MESIDFLLEQRNYQAATNELCILEKEIETREVANLLDET